MGAIQFGPDGNQDESVVVVLVKFALAVAAIALADYFVFRYAVELTQRNVAIAAGVHNAGEIAGRWNWLGILTLWVFYPTRIAAPPPGLATDWNIAYGGRSSWREGIRICSRTWLR